MAESIFASKAVVGMRYLTHRGMPLLVLSHKDNGDATVKSELTGNTMEVPGSKLFFPYKKDKISKEAIQMAKASKEATQKEGGATARQLKAIGTRRVLKRQYKGKDIVVSVASDGFRYGGKLYASLAEAAQAATGKAYIQNGLRFFQLGKWAA